jgi:uncharacterized membrane protein YgdD (TMEM256/DUF423 family)
MRAALVLGSGFAFLGVALGAFGAHALRGRLAPEMLAIYQTGVQYQMFHALGLVLIGAVADRLDAARLVAWATGLLASGVLLFSGSLYALAWTGARGLGAVTPLGGVCFLLGWLLLAVAAVRQPGEPARERSGAASRTRRGSA